MKLHIVSLTFLVGLCMYLQVTTPSVPNMFIEIRIHYLFLVIVLLSRLSCLATFFLSITWLLLSGHDHDSRRTIESQDIGGAMAMKDKLSSTAVLPTGILGNLNLYIMNVDPILLVTHHNGGYQANPIYQ